MSIEVDRLPLIPLDQRAENVRAVRYLAGLGSEHSRKAMRTALAKVASIVAAVPCRDGVPLGGYGRVQLDAIPWAAVTVDHCLHVRRVLSEQGAPATANLAMAALRGVLAECGTLDEAKRRATKAVRGNVVNHAAPLETQGLAAILGACAADQRPVRRRAVAREPRLAAIRDAALIGLLALGLRRSEAAALALDDYKPGWRMLHVRRGKGGKTRLVPVPEAVATVLDRWLAARPSDVGGAFLLAMNRGGRVTGPMSAHAIYKRLTLRARQAGVVASPHALRAWIAGEVIGVSDVSTAARLLGHSQLSTTLVYDRAPDRRVRRAIDAVAFPAVAV